MLKFAVLFLFLSVPAFAEEQGLTFDSLRLACKSPAQFHNQVAPKNIEVMCQDVQSKWVPDSSGTMKLSGDRGITTSLISDKYTVSPTTEKVPVADQLGVCPNFKEIVETVSYSRATSCDEILAFEGSGTQFCLSILDDLRKVNPQSISAKDTGRALNYCAGSASSQQQKSNE